MAISALRQKFLDQSSTNQIARLRQPLSSKEALAEYQVELDRVDRIRSLDGSDSDLNPAPNAFKMRTQGSGLSPASEGWGSAHEARLANRNHPVLEYSLVESVQPGPPAPGDETPATETVFQGSNNRDENSWFVRRLVETPTNLTYEEVHINYADPATSYKDVWLFKP